MSDQKKEIAKILADLNADSLTKFLSPFRNNQPVFIHNVVNLLEGVKRSSDIKLIQKIAAQLGAQSELLTIMDEYKERLHTLERKQVRFQQKDDLEDLDYELDKKRKLREIESLSGDAAGKEEARQRELDELALDLRHQQKIRAIKEEISAESEIDKRSRKTKEFDDMVATYQRQFDAIDANTSLTPAAKKETLRTLEETFIKQLDEFKRGL